jgi:CBS domain-containing protein
MGRRWSGLSESGAASSSSQRRSPPASEVERADAEELPGLGLLTEVERRGTAPPSQRELLLDTEMRTFHHLWDVQERHKLTDPALLELLDLSQYEAEGRGLPQLDLTRFMHRPVMTVRKECSAARVYTIFRALGLRHMCVVDADHHPVGMITRVDLMRELD